MIRVVFRFFGSYQSGCGRAMMTVGNVHVWYGCKNAGDGFDIFLVANQPKMVSDSVFRNKIIFRLFQGNAFYDSFQFRIVRIGKKYRFHIGVGYSHMFHPVFFFVAACQFVFFYFSCKIIFYGSSHYQSILGFPVHCLSVHIIHFFRVLYQPSILLKFAKIFGGFFIYPWIMFVCSLRKVNFGFSDAI